MTKLFESLSHPMCGLSYSDSWAERQTKERVEKTMRSFPALFDQAMVVDVQNVHDSIGYKKVDPVNYVSNVAPLDAVMWMEYEIPGTGPIGFLVIDGEDQRSEIRTIPIYLFCIDNARHRADSPVIKMFGETYIKVRSDGQCLAFSDQSFNEVWDADKMQRAVLPVLFGLSLAHCKNVALERVEGRRQSRQARREAERRGNPGAISYHVLNIIPMKQVLSGDANSEPSGLKKALHICRGHFANYGKKYGKGKLFGKYEGQFWVPSHVRGDVEQGIADKDYAVQATNAEGDGAQ